MLTLSDIKRLKEAGLIRGYSGEETAGNSTQNAPQGKKGSKYGAVKVEVDGILFDSKKEANRYKELKLLLKAGHIAYLELQKEYELNEGGTHSLIYRADFVYIDLLTMQTVVEDTKGFKTREYKKKKRLMKKIYGIEIKET